MATPSQVDALLDDAALARVEADEAVTDIQQLAVMMIRAGRRILADCRVAKAGHGEINVALVELRALRPSVRGRRADLEEAVA